MKCDKELKPIKTPCDISQFTHEFDKINQIEQELISKMVDKINTKREELLVEGLKLKGIEFEDKNDLLEFISIHVSWYKNLNYEYFTLYGEDFLRMHFCNTLDNPIGFSQKDIEVKWVQKFTYEFL